MFKFYNIALFFVAVITIAPLMNASYLRSVDNMIVIVMHTLRMYLFVV